MTADLINQFTARLDEILGLAAASPKTDKPQIEAALRTASLLAEMDFDSEIAPRAEIRSMWTRQAQRSGPKRPSQELRALRWTWVFILIILLALLVAFRQPVFAAINRMFGYVYVSDIGFLPMDSTLMLEQPIIQKHNGQTVTVTRGIATPQNSILFLEFNDIARPVDGAWLETSSGERLELLQWQYWPNTPGSRGARLIFPPLPAGAAQTTLALPEGWRLPLKWIPASQSNLPDVRAVPYAAQTSEPPAAAENLCVEKQGLKLCVLAATTSAENTSVLLQAQSANPQLIAGDMWQGLVWQTEAEQVRLTDEQGRIFPMDSEQNGTLTFPPLAANQKVTLTVPALLATVDIPDQSITVNMGDDPQPGDIIPLDASIQVLGATVHFSKATFDGDGVNSLRLTLNADEPIQTVDGITPASFELGKPERVDDLYGSGMLNGSKDIFIELIRPNGKIAGTLTIPILRAAVIVIGPFEFSFVLTDASSLTPTPAAADPSIFSPAPTPTPLAVDSYFFSGQTLEAGDLLYIVWNGNQSDIYRFTPSMNIDRGLFLTLPGHVSSLNLHPDRQGMDYLAGIYNKNSNTLEEPQLYTLRFTDPQPRRLNVTPPGRLIPFYLAWSYDGQLLAFNVASNAPGEMDTIGWIDLGCRGTGECPITVFDDPTGNGLRLSDSAFSPSGDWLALNGTDSESGANDIYILPFDGARPRELYNLTQTPWQIDDIYSWASDDTLVWICESGDMGNPTRAICLRKVTDLATPPEIIFSFDDWQFIGIAPNGKYFWQIVINRQAEREQQIWLRDRNGSSSLLTAAPMFNLDYGKPAFSMDGQYLAYTSTTDTFKTVPDTLYVINTTTGQKIVTFEIKELVGWLGWVH